MLNIGLIFVGAGPIYVLSNLGYVVSFIPALPGYHFSGCGSRRSTGPSSSRFKYVAVLLAVLHLIA